MLKWRPSRDSNPGHFSSSHLSYWAILSAPRGKACCPSRSGSVSVSVEPVRAWMPPINPTAQGLLPFLAVAIRGRIHLRACPAGALVCGPGIPDLLLFFPVFQIHRLLAVIRAGRIPVRTSFAGVVSMIAKCFCHSMPPNEWARAGIEPAR